MRQRHLDHLRARVLHPLDALPPKRIDLGRHVVDAIFLRNPDPLALEVDREVRLPLGHRQVERGRVLRVEAAHRLQQDRAVAHVARHRPRLVERRREGDDPPARAAAIGRLDPRNTGERRRLANRAAGVRPRRARAQPRRHRGRAAARGAARRKRRIAAVAPPPGRDDVAERAGLVGRAHRKLVHVELAQHPRARAPEVGGDGRLIGWREAAQDGACGGGLHALGAEQVFHANGHARERLELARRARLVRGVGRGQRMLRRLDDERVERLRPGDALDERFRHLARAERAVAHPVSDRRDAEVRKLLTHAQAPVSPTPLGLSVSKPCPSFFPPAQEKNGPSTSSGRTEWVGRLRTIRSPSEPRRSRARPAARWRAPCRGCRRR